MPDYCTAKKSLSELRQLYFKMKDKVFGTVRFGVAYNTEALEQLLKDELGSSTRLSDVEFPKCVSVKSMVILVLVAFLLLELL